MSDTPNCAITVSYYEETDRFSYACTNSSRGWQVLPDGSIYPPNPSRVVQFSLKGFPNTARFAAFQIASSPEALPAESKHWPDPCVFGVTPKLPAPFPPGDNDATFTELTFDFGDNRFFYRLAVVVDGSNVLHWDDPQIHDDGSQ